MDLDQSFVDVAKNSHHSLEPESAMDALTVLKMDLGESVIGCFDSHSGRISLSRRDKPEDHKWFLEGLIKKISGEGEKLPLDLHLVICEAGAAARAILAGLLPVIEAAENGKDLFNISSADIGDYEGLSFAMLKDEGIFIELGLDDDDDLDE